MGEQYIWKNLDLSDLEDEIWKGIVGFDGFYEISNLGRVKSFRRRGIGNILKQNLNRGYCKVGLFHNGVKISKSVHRLVLECFNPTEDLSKNCVDHINEIKTDNRIENLRWCTHRENSIFYHSDKANQTSSFVGVHFDKIQSLWKASIQINGEKITIGRFKEEGDAKLAYLDVLYNGKISIDKYRKNKFGCIFKRPSGSYGISIQIDKNVYIATTKTYNDAKKCLSDCEENGIEQINKYKKEKDKYNFEVNNDIS